MKQYVLTPDDILVGFDAVSQLYPHIPPMSIWRSWEYAAYKNYELKEPVLDVGCGDGQFLKLVWPRILDVTGVDVNAVIVNIAKHSGVYREVLVGSADSLPFRPQSFASAFANCSLEHMDHLPEVLSSVFRSLRPGGVFLLSVVTQNLLEWISLPHLIEIISGPQRAKTLQAEYEKFHHLVNPYPPEVWIEYLKRAGFKVLEYIPIVPEISTRLFLFLDHIWHVQQPKGEVGDVLQNYFKSITDFPHAFRDVLTGILKMERDFNACSGAVFMTCRRGL
jgi:SAM-dependent methyltransferase